MPDVRVLQIGGQIVLEIEPDAGVPLAAEWCRRWADAGRAALADWCSASPVAASARVDAGRGAELLALARGVREQ